MTSIKALSTKLAKITAILNPPAKETRLPMVFAALPADGQDANTWTHYPGCEERNLEMMQLAKRWGVPYSLYFGIGPDEDGIVA